jgi:predicted ATPase
MGVVYEAILHGPAGFEKRVALKVLHTQGRGLAHEARLGGLMRHPNVVEVYELGEVDGVWFCAMQLVDGGSITQYVPLAPRAVVEVGLQVCAGLQHAHESVGLVHLDLKPDNILLDGAVVKVADLGIARARNVTHDGRVRGTPGYMSPEQQTGADVDARSDIFSLGVVLRELATGHNPGVAVDGTFDFDTAEATATSVVAFGQVPWLADVLARCLEPDPADRYPSMAALGDALRALVVPGPGLAELTGAAQTAIPHISSSDSEPERERTNIGPEQDAFIGRGDELAELARGLSLPGLLTLKGPAGVGKTRLSQAAARAHHQITGEQVWFCDLSEARSVDGILYAVGSAMGVPLGPDPEVQLGHAIAGRDAAVIVLDNFEQVVQHASVIHRWRERATSATFLVTSREPLGLRGERVVEVTPLAVVDATALLVERARARGRDVEGDPALVELARALDGLPLALELAAGRLGVLTPARVLARLSDRLRLLRRGPTGTSDRQSTLRGALDWGWDLLDADQRAGLAQLSVFAGGFTVEAAEEVLELPDGTWALDVVEALLDRSWLTGRDGRLGMLESVRVYAESRLDDDSAATIRHGAWAVALGALAGPEGSRSQLNALRAELDNLVAACRRAVGRGDGECAVASLESAWKVMDMTGPYEAASTLAEAVASTALLPSLRARLDQCWSGILRRLERVDDAHVLLESALATHLTTGDRRSEGIVLGDMGTLHCHRGQWDEARAHLEAALVIHRALGNRRSEGAVLLNLGTTYGGRRPAVRGYVARQSGRRVAQRGPQ